jgi:hypothetical protein
MNILQRISFPLLIVMMFVLPFWISLGRAFLFNIAGYYILLYFFYSAVLFGWLIYIYKSLKERPDIRLSGLMKSSDAKILLAIYLVVFAHGFFWLDQADSLNQASPVTVWLHIDTGVSWVFSILTFLATLFLLCLSSVLATPKITKQSSKKYSN